MCVFQGAAGPDGPRGERVNQININLTDETVAPGDTRDNVCKILRRDKVERRASRVPVETEVQEEMW